MQIKSLESFYKKLRKNALVPAFLFLLAALVLFLCCFRYAYNTVLGPFKLSSAELSACRNANFLLKYYLLVSGKTALITPFYFHESNKARIRNNAGSQAAAGRISAYFFLLPLKDGYLLVRSPNSVARSIYTGELKNMPAGLHSGLKAKLEKAIPGLGKRLFRVMLISGEDFESSFNLILLVFLILVFSGCGFFLRAKRISLEDENGVLARSLAAGSDYSAWLAEIEKEISLSGPDADAGLLMLLANWVLIPDSSGLQARKLASLVWVYAVKSESLFSSASHKLVIICKNGDKIELSGTAVEVDQSVNVLSRRLPWLYKNYTAEIDELWRKNPEIMLRVLKEKELEIKLRTYDSGKESG